MFVTKYSIYVAGIALIALHACAPVLRATHRDGLHTAQADYCLQVTTIAVLVLSKRLMCGSRSSLQDTSTDVVVSLVALYALTARSAAIADAAHNTPMTRSANRILRMLPPEPRMARAAHRDGLTALFSPTSLRDEVHEADEEHYTDCPNCDGQEHAASLTECV